MACFGVILRRIRMVSSYSYTWHVVPSARQVSTWLIQDWSL